MPVCLVPPQSEAIERVLWQILEEHGLAPAPFGACPSCVLPHEHVEKFMAKMPDEPFPKTPGRYRMIPFRVDMTSSRGIKCVQGVRSAIVEHSGPIELWKGGVHIPRATTGSRARFSQVAILPLDLGAQTHLVLGPMD